jgi:hypothetical protein
MTYQIDLRSVDLGAPAAERDILRGLEHYFVKSDAFLRVANRTKTIILGNRGVGKSAIFQVVAQEARKRNAIAIELAPEDYSYELLRTALAEEAEGSWAKMGAFAVAWKYLIYVLVMQELVSRSGGRPRKGPMAKITSYIRDNHPTSGLSKLSALIGYLKRVEGVKIGPIEAGLKTRELEKLYKLEEIQDLLPALAKILERQEVLVFVDELDRGWDAKENAQAFVAGLFQACLTINNVSPNLTVYMSLRQELYDNIPALYEDAQKYRDLIETVSWNEAGLREMLAARLRYSIPELREMSDQECWNSVFSETLSYRQNKSFNYMVDRTLYRPRELIQFSAQTIEAGVKLQTPPPLDYAVISQAELAYSEDRAKDIAAEFRFQYPGLLSLFEIFRGRVHTYDRDTLQYLCLELITGDAATAPEAYTWIQAHDPDSLIDVLWRIGFLRAQAVGGVKAQRRSGSSYMGPHQASNLSLMNTSRFQVHPMFRSFLGLKEPKGSSSDQRAFQGSR